MDIGFVDPIAGRVFRLRLGKRVPIWVILPIRRCRQSAASTQYTYARHYCIQHLVSTIHNFGPGA